jgi:hypothetical protein
VSRHLHGRAGCGGCAPGECGWNGSISAEKSDAAAVAPVAGGKEELRALLRSIGKTSITVSPSLLHEVTVDDVQRISEAGSRRRFSELLEQAEKEVAVIRDAGVRGELGDALQGVRARLGALESSPSVQVEFVDARERVRSALLVDLVRRLVEGVGAAVGSGGSVDGGEKVEVLVRVVCAGEALVWAAGTRRMGRLLLLQAGAAAELLLQEADREAQAAVDGALSLAAEELRSRLKELDDEIAARAAHMSLDDARSLAASKSMATRRNKQRMKNKAPSAPTEAVARGATAALREGNVARAQRLLRADGALEARRRGALRDVHDLERLRDAMLVDRTRPWAAVEPARNLRLQVSAVPRSVTLTSWNVDTEVTSGEKQPSRQPNLASLSSEAAHHVLTLHTDGGAQHAAGLLVPKAPFANLTLPIDTALGGGGRTARRARQGVRRELRDVVQVRRLLRGIVFRTNLAEQVAVLVANLLVALAAALARGDVVGANDVIIGLVEALKARADALERRRAENGTRDGVIAHALVTDALLTLQAGLQNKNSFPLSDEAALFATRSGNTLYGDMNSLVRQCLLAAAGGRPDGARTEDKAWVAEVYWGGHPLVCALTRAVLALSAELGKSELDLRALALFERLNQLDGCGGLHGFAAVAAIVLGMRKAAGALESDERLPPSILSIAATAMAIRERGRDPSSPSTAWAWTPALVDALETFGGGGFVPPFFKGEAAVRADNSPLLAAHFAGLLHGRAVPLAAHLVREVAGGEVSFKDAEQLVARVLAAPVDVTDVALLSFGATHALSHDTVHSLAARMRPHLAALRTFRLDIKADIDVHSKRLPSKIHNLVHGASSREIQSQMEVWRAGLATAVFALGAAVECANPHADLHLRVELDPGLRQILFTRTACARIAPQVLSAAGLSTASHDPITALFPGAQIRNKTPHAVNTDGVVCRVVDHTATLSQSPTPASASASPPAPPTGDDDMPSSSTTRYLLRLQPKTSAERLRTRRHSIPAPSSAPPAPASSPSPSISQSAAQTAPSTESRALPIGHIVAVQQVLLGGHTTTTRTGTASVAAAPSAPQEPGASVPTDDVNERVLREAVGVFSDVTAPIPAASSAIAALIAANPTALESICQAALLALEPASARTRVVRTIATIPQLRHLAPLQRRIAAMFFFEPPSAARDDFFTFTCAFSEALSDGERQLVFRASSTNTPHPTTPAPAAASTDSARAPSLPGPGMQSTADTAPDSANASTAAAGTLLHTPAFSAGGHGGAAGSGGAGARGASRGRLPRSAAQSSPPPEFPPRPAPSFPPFSMHPLHPTPAAGLGGDGAVHGAEGVDEFGVDGGARGAAVAHDVHEAGSSEPKEERRTAPSLAADVVQAIRAEALRLEGAFAPVLVACDPGTTHRFLFGRVQDALSGSLFKKGHGSTKKNELKSMTICPGCAEDGACVARHLQRRPRPRANARSAEGEGADRGGGDFRERRLQDVEGQVVRANDAADRSPRNTPRAAGLHRR